MRKFTVFFMFFVSSILAENIYVGNYSTPSISVIDSATDTVIQTISTPPMSNPDRVIRVPGTNLIYYTSPNNNTVIVFDALSNEILTSIVVGSSPKELVASPNGSRVYVANEGSGNLSVIDTTTHSLIQTIAVGPLTRALAIHPNGNKVYMGGINSVYIVDVSNIMSPTVLPLPLPPMSGNPVHAVITPSGNKVYITYRLGEFVAVIDTVAQTVSQILTPAEQPNDLSIKPDGTAVYVSSKAGPGNVLIISTTTDMVVATLAVGATPRQITFSLDQTKAYVANQSSGDVSVISTAFPYPVLATIPVGVNPEMVAITSDGLKGYVSNQSGSPGISVLNLITNTVLGGIVVGANPFELLIFNPTPPSPPPSPSANNVITVAASTPTYAIGQGLLTAIINWDAYVPTVGFNPQSFRLKRKSITLDVPVSSNQISIPISDIIKQINVLADVPGTVRSFVDVGLEPGLTYRYTVVGIDTNSSPSEEVVPPDLTVVTGGSIP